MALTLNEEKWPLHLSLVGHVGKGLNIQPILCCYCFEENVLNTLVANFHGISPVILKDAPNRKKVQETVTRIVKNRTLILHAGTGDIEALGLKENELNCEIIRIADYFPDDINCHTISLKDLAYYFLDITIQEYRPPLTGSVHGGRHDSFTDAMTTLKIFKVIRKKLEQKEELPTFADIKEYIECAQKRGDLPSKPKKARFMP